MGQYDIGSGKKFYTDVNANVEGEFAGEVKYILSIHCQHNFIQHRCNVVCFSDVTTCLRIAMLYDH